MAGELPDIQQSLQKASPGAVEGREPARTCNLQRESHKSSLGTVRNRWEKHAIKEALQKACIVQQSHIRAWQDHGRASLSSILVGAYSHQAW